jgi:(1->4)-alpha-D-glucan 1-alpha-D-glucosylmutase
VDVERFHAWNLRRLDTWPHGLSTTATHDTKRGEDMRARLDVLSEIPREWRQAVRRWQRLNRRLKSLVDDARVPETNEEYLLYQTLVGIWPMDGVDDDLPEAVREALVSRVAAYMNKAVREAKVHSSWINVNSPYERGIDQFVRRLLGPTPSGTSAGEGADMFLADLRRFVGTIAMPGLYNSLVQVVLKATAPGVPDFYQGTELLDFSLVDPDNRRPIDYAPRRALLADIPALEEALPGFIEEALRLPADGGLKLLITARALRHRRANLATFERGAYLPLALEGERARHAIAFARVGERATSLTVAGRFFAVLSGAARPVGEAVWGQTRLSLPPSLPPGAYRDALSGGRVTAEDDGAGHRFLRLGDVFTTLPIAILEPC